MARMDRIAVLRCGSDVRWRLGTAPRDAGSVHSVFDRVVNLIWHDGRLLTLQAPAPLVAPFAAEVTRLPRGDGVGPGARVWRRADVVLLDGVELEWDAAAIVQTIMPEAAGAPCGVLSGLLGNQPAGGARGLSSTAGRRAQSRLAEGLSRRAPELFIEGADGLLGLGEGLTPAGDDCLVGALAAIHRFAGSWLREHPRITTSISGRAAAATTTVAREFVTHALEGRFAETLIDLLTGQSAEAIARAAAQLRRTGASSGADTLIGVRLAVLALGTNRGDDPHAGQEERVP